MRVFIDAGHNFSGCDTGATGNGLREQDITYLIAKELKALLTDSGYEVMLSRNTPEENLGCTTSESLKLRCKMSNEWGADLFVSIHCNAHDNVNTRGTEVFAYSLNSTAGAYAKNIQSAIVNKLGMTDRGVKQYPWYVLEHTKAPAVLVETGFITNGADAMLLVYNRKDFAEAIYEGIIGKKKEENNVGQTVMELKGNIYVQEIEPKDFEIKVVDCKKKDISSDSYFNCGFFTAEKSGKTIPVGNLANNGVVYSTARENASWINLSGHKLTTIYTAERGISGNIICLIEQTDDIKRIPNLKTAISGIPVIVGGKRVSLDEIKAEGYFGDEVYDTWHGFLGIRHNKLVYIAMKCGFDEMCWALVALGIYDAIKLDGGGSFVLKDNKILEATSENRRIHNIGVWM